MIGVLHWLLAFTAAVGVECVIAFLLAGRGHRRATLLACLFANLAFEPIRVMTESSRDVWTAVGFLLVLFGETFAYGELARLRAAHALAIVLLANVAATFVMGAMV